jgi:DNA-binding transcriptional MerR regulator
VSLIRVGDVARELDETAVTIRYWSDFFTVPVDRKKGQRRYNREAVGRLRLVKQLVRTEGYRLDAARKHYLRLLSCRW